MYFICIETIKKNTTIFFIIKSKNSKSNVHWFYTNNILLCFTGKPTSAAMNTKAMVLSIASTVNVDF